MASVAQLCSLLLLLVLVPCGSKAWLAPELQDIISNGSLAASAASGNGVRKLAMFVFGDSLVDVGNNNYIASTARANYRPFGVDYPSGPTGRFCNGKIISDFISDTMGTPPVKPYLDPSNNKASLLLGANFASAGAGLLNSTGRQFVVVISADEQMDMFADYKRRMAGYIGEDATEKLVRDSLISVTLAGNDYINNYLQKYAVSNKQYTLPQFQDLLIATYKTYLTKLYNMGGRKFTITSLGPLGCIPRQLNDYKVTDGKCIEKLQQLALSFNAALKPMTEELNKELPGAIFLYINSFDSAMTYISNPAAYGYVTSNTACCGQGNYNGRFICNRFSSLCPDRTIYVFWDPFHPTERTNSLLTARVLDGPLSDVSPINVRQLLSLPPSD